MKLITALSFLVALVLTVTLLSPAKLFLVEHADFSRGFAEFVMVLAFWTPALVLFAISFFKFVNRVSRF